MPDPVAATIAYLKTDTALTALVGARVFGGEVPRTEVEFMPRACVLIRPSGGGIMGLTSMAIRDVRVDLECYGATPLAAWNLHAVVKTALKGMPRTYIANTMLLWAKESSGGSMLRDPDTAWPLISGAWQVLASEDVP